MFAPALSPTAPPTPSARWVSQDSARTMALRMPQCHSSAATAEVTITSGRMSNTITTGRVAPARSSKGSSPPPR